MSIVAKFAEVSVRPGIEDDIAKTPCGRPRITFTIFDMNFSSKTNSLWLHDKFCVKKRKKRKEKAKENLSLEFVRRSL